MEETVVTRGCPSLEEIRATSGYPDDAAFGKGALAVLECVQEIPCNPCEQACPFGAITVGTPITSIPHIDWGKCEGCGRCVACCPGLAIFIVNKVFEPGKATVSFPHEYLPLPEKGDTVQAVNRMGQVVCPASVHAVNTAKGNDGTTVVTLVVPLEHADEVRGMKRGGRDNG